VSTVPGLRNCVVDSGSFHTNQRWYAIVTIETIYTLTAPMSRGQVCNDFQWLLYHCHLMAGDPSGSSRTAGKNVCLHGSPEAPILLLKKTIVNEYTTNEPKTMTGFRIIVTTVVTAGDSVTKGICQPYTSPSCTSRSRLSTAVSSARKNQPLYRFVRASVLIAAIPKTVGGTKLCKQPPRWRLRNSLHRCRRAFDGFSCFRTPSPGLGWQFRLSFPRRYRKIALHLAP